MRTALTCLLLAFGSQATAEPDYANVMVVVHTTDDCVPCGHAKAVMAKLHEQHPRLWLVYVHNLKLNTTARQYKGKPHAFMSEGISIRGYPTISVYQEMGDGRAYAERYRLVGFGKGDAELLEMMLRMAAE